MSIATITSKGQITIPIDVRKELKVDAGSKLEFIPDGKGAYRIVPKKISVMELLGSIPAGNKVVSLEEMNEAIASGAVESYIELEGNDQ